MLAGAAKSNTGASLTLFTVNENVRVSAAPSLSLTWTLTLWVPTCSFVGVPLSKPVGESESQSGRLMAW